MAGKNTFALLQMYAVKEVKYKQSEHIDRASQIFNVTGPHWDEIAAGICPVLTALWLEEKIKGAEGTVFERSAHVPAVRHDGHASLVMSLAQDFRVYELDAQRFRVRRALELLAQRHQMRVCREAHGTREAIFKIIEDELPPRFGAILDCRFRRDHSRIGGPRPLDLSHIVGICCLGSRLYFFDPNIGGYRLNGREGDFEEFGEMWEALLYDAYNWDLANCSAYFVL